MKQVFSSIFHIFRTLLLMSKSGRRSKWRSYFLVVRKVRNRTRKREAGSRIAFSSHFRLPRLRNQQFRNRGISSFLSKLKFYFSATYILCRLNLMRWWCNNTQFFQVFACPRIFIRQNFTFQAVYSSIFQHWKK